MTLRGNRPARATSTLSGRPSNGGSLRIDDPADPRLEPYRSLRGDHRRRPRFVAESPLAVTRLLASRFEVESVLCTPAHEQRIAPHVPRSVPLLVAEERLVGDVVGFDFHRGCLAVGRRPDPDPPPDLARLAERRRWIVVVAEGLVDPANVGALIRNCRAFDAALLLLDPRGADPFSRRAIRASLGHSFTQPLVTLEELPRWVERLHRELGARVLAATVSPSATSIDDLLSPARSVLLVGNEGTGLSEALRSRAQQEITIPIEADADSLNVAAATAVLLHALRRARDV